MFWRSTLVDRSSDSYKQVFYVLSDLLLSFFNTPAFSFLIVYPARCLMGKSQLCGGLVIQCRPNLVQTLVSFSWNLKLESMDFIHSYTYNTFIQFCCLYTVSSELKLLKSFMLVYCVCHSVIKHSTLSSRYRFSRPNTDGRFDSCSITFHSDYCFMKKTGSVLLNCLCCKMFDG